MGIAVIAAAGIAACSCALLVFLNRSGPSYPVAVGNERTKEALATTQPRSIGNSVKEEPGTAVGVQTIPSTPLQSDEVRKPLPPLPPDLAVGLNQEYLRLARQADAAKEQIAAAAAGDKDLSQLIQFEQNQLSVPLTGMAYSQAFENPTLRNMLMSMLRDPGFFVEFRNLLGQNARQLGLTIDYQATTAEDLVARLRASEQIYQTRFLEMTEKYQVTGGLAQAMADERTAEWLTRLTQRYMFVYGFQFDQRQQLFVKTIK